MNVGKLAYNVLGGLILTTGMLSMGYETFIKPIHERGRMDAIEIYSNEDLSTIDTRIDWDSLSAKDNEKWLKHLGIDQEQPVDSTQ
tara:strand:- start:115 stop:372 length:258 start_codon:yes stop_codon:yes gene_type:complete